jgi:4-oxalocrotonate tautomerase family enzyme
MPVINIAMHKVDDQTKTDLIREITATAVNITKVSAERFTVFIDEKEPMNIGIGGKTYQEIKAGR